ncbi:MAG: hypothetical protein WBP41_17300 [Saprospiraceae bacterium]
MKNTVLNFLSIKRTLISLITFGIFLVGTSHAQAPITTGYISQASVSFISIPAAKIKVDGKLTEINTLLGTLNNQSQEYLYAGFKRDFYSGIHDQLNAGKSVRESLEFGINLLITGNIATQLPKLNREQYKQEAISLLRV